MAPCTARVGIAAAVGTLHWLVHCRALALRDNLRCWCRCSWGQIAGVFRVPADALTLVQKLRVLAAVANTVGPVADATRRALVPDDELFFVLATAARLRRRVAFVVNGTRCVSAFFEHTFRGTRMARRVAARDDTLCAVLAGAGADGVRILVHGAGHAACGVNALVRAFRAGRLDAVADLRPDLVVVETVRAQLTGKRLRTGVLARRAQGALTVLGHILARDAWVVVAQVLSRFELVTARRASGALRSRRGVAELTRRTRRAARHTPGILVAIETDRAQRCGLHHCSSRGGREQSQQNGFHGCLVKKGQLGQEKCSISSQQQNRSGHST